MTQDLNTEGLRLMNILQDIDLFKIHRKKVFVLLPGPEAGNNTCLLLLSYIFK